MTIGQVMSHGFCERHEHGSTARLEYVNRESARRFMDLQWVLEARRLNLRTAHRRWLRRNGFNFHGERRVA